MNKKSINGLIILLLLLIIGIISYIFVFSNKIVEVQGILLNKNSLKLIIGDSEKLEVNVLPEDATNKEIIWESDNKNIASVTDGIVTANNIGSTVINVKSKDGNASTKCFVYVEKKKVETILINKDVIDLVVDDKEKLSVTIFPEELQDDDITWLSSNSKVAIVDQNGEVTARGEGTATITVTSSDGSKNSSCVVNVSGPPAILVNKVEINKKSNVLVKGASDVLEATITPPDATDKTVKWVSSNQNIVSVSNDGKIVAKDIGEATITVITTDGDKKDSLKIKVVDIINFEQRNEAMVEYMKSPLTIKSIYNRYKCGKKSCISPNKYKTSLSGTINVYQYNKSNNTKSLIASATSGSLNYYLIPNKTYYLESRDDTSKVEVVKVVGDVRFITSVGVGNFRDLGGWSTDEGTTVKYGIIYRGASTDKLNDDAVKYLSIRKIIDLRTTSQISSSATSVSKNMRKVVSIVQYNTNSKTRTAVTEIMKTVVNERKNVIFNCAIGRDRTGTVAYIIEGILGVTLENRKRDFELSYFPTYKRIRSDSSFQSLINQINKYEKTKYDQERFINWYLSSSTNKNSDLELINNFRKRMIDGNPKEYKLVNGKLTIV